MSQIAKEAIFLSQILWSKPHTSIGRSFDHILWQQNNTAFSNRRNRKLLVTKLRHVDIHDTHWLRQEVRNKRVETHWVPTKDMNHHMMADGLTKSLGHQKHVHFVAMIGLANELEHIEREQSLMEELKELIQKARIHDEQQLILSRGPTTRILKELGLWGGVSRGFYRLIRMIPALLLCTNASGSGEEHSFYYYTLPQWRSTHSPPYRLLLGKYPSWLLVSLGFVYKSRHNPSCT